MADEPCSSSFCKTLFVRNLPFLTTNEKLVECFEDYGPIKSCFVVKDKASDDKCRGFGYVTFSVREDAETAQKKVKTVLGRRVAVVFANPQNRKKKGKKGKTLEKLDDSAVGQQKTIGQDENEKISSKEPSSSAKALHIAGSTIVLSGVPKGFTKEQVQDVVSDVENVIEVVFPAPRRSQPTALIRVRSKKDAVKATKKLNNKHCKDLPVKAVLLNQEGRTPVQVPHKKCKLIVRNLSFKCKESDLWAAFDKFGTITDVKIPLNENKRMFGYGFVQFSTLMEAATGLKAMNAKPILGRPVAVDWAVEREKYQQSLASNEKKPAVENEETKGDSMDHGQEESVMVTEEEESWEEEQNEEKIEENEENDETSERCDDDSDEGDDEDEDDDSLEDDDDSDEGFSDGSSEDDEAKQLNSKRVQKNELAEGRTIFIRNISYDTEEEDLEDLFSAYGELKYCRIVMDKETDHSKGTAFVQFVMKEDAERCLDESEDDKKKAGGLVCDGRRLKLAWAVSRENAVTKKGKEAKEQKDKRNLWLLREGMIRAGTQAAQGLAPDDLAKREQIEKMKRQKLKNPDIFVSPTRLCVHNLPTSVDDKQLRKIFIRAAEDRAAIVSECRIMRDLNRVNSQGVGKSRGYAFVAFTEHKHALSALRYTNNNPSLFGEKKRMIVEFSLENRAALRAKQVRIERMKMKQESMKKNVAGAASASTRGPRKGMKRASVAAVQPPPPSNNPNKKVPKGMPSHWGPKIRHKARGPAKVASKPKDKKSRTQAQRDRKRGAGKQLVQPLSKRSKKQEKTDNMDKLINKYKTTITQAVRKQKDVKWFQT